MGVKAYMITIKNTVHFSQMSFRQVDTASVQTDVLSSLPIHARWLKPGGMFYFSINFDGETIFEPVSDQDREDKLITLYHQSMDGAKIRG